MKTHKSETPRFTHISRCEFVKEDIAGAGDCGFEALGFERAAVVQKLLESKDEAVVQECIAGDVLNLLQLLSAADGQEAQQKVSPEVFDKEPALINQFLNQGWQDAYAQLRQTTATLDTALSEVHDQVKGDFQDMDQTRAPLPAALIAKLSDPKYTAQRTRLSEALEACSQANETLCTYAKARTEDFINLYLAKGGYLTFASRSDAGGGYGTLAAIGHLYSIAPHVYEVRDGSLALVNAPPQAGEKRYIIYDHAKKHFDRLVLQEPEKKKEQKVDARYTDNAVLEHFRNILDESTEFLPKNAKVRTYLQDVYEARFRVRYLRFLNRIGCSPEPVLNIPDTVMRVMAGISQEESIIKHEIDQLSGKLRQAITSKFSPQMSMSTSDLTEMQSFSSGTLALTHSVSEISEACKGAITQMTKQKNLDFLSQKFGVAYRNFKENDNEAKALENRTRARVVTLVGSVVLIFVAAAQLVVHRLISDTDGRRKVADATMDAIILIVNGVAGLLGGFYIARQLDFDNKKQKEEIGSRAFESVGATPSSEEQWQKRIFPSSTTELREIVIG